MSSLFGALQRLFGGPKRPREAPASLATDDDLRWVHPPANLLDADAWDQYWNDQLAHGLGPPLFDMFCDERPLIKTMTENGMKSILCAGNGISMEPRALAAAGFEVVALDLSPRALQVARTFPSSAELLAHFLGAGSRRPGGRVEYVVGNILDPVVCPGPFDVIIERRTAQNYPVPELARVMAALAARLSPHSILFTHCHDGSWRPRAEPRHVTSEWCREHGWVTWNGVDGTKPEGRVVWLLTSTG